jgi:membrane protein involved in colicin uptake
MAKATRKAKAHKKTAAKKKKAAKKAVAPRKAKKAAKRGAPSPAVTGLVAVDSKNAAINSCVNDLMNTARPGWSDNGKMDADYGYNNHSMRAFLSTVQSCLQGKHFKFNFNDDGFVNSCVSAAVYRLKLLIYSRTT